MFLGVYLLSREGKSQTGFSRNLHLLFSSSTNSRSIILWNHLETTWTNDLSVGYSLTVCGSLLYQLLILFQSFGLFLLWTCTITLFLFPEHLSFSSTSSIWCSGDVHWMVKTWPAFSCLEIIGRPFILFLEASLDWRTGSWRWHYWSRASPLQSSASSLSWAVDHRSNPVPNGPSISKEWLGSRPLVSIKRIVGWVLMSRV